MKTIKEKIGIAEKEFELLANIDQLIVNHLGNNAEDYFQLLARYTIFGLTANEIPLSLYVGKLEELDRIIEKSGARADLVGIAEVAKRDN